MNVVKDGMTMIPLSGIDDDYESDLANINESGNESKKLDISPTEKDVIVVDEVDDERSEQIQLVNMKKENVEDEDEGIDIDIAKKNQLICTWDVVVAIICIVVSTILSLVVIAEKLYIMINT